MLSISAAIIVLAAASAGDSTNASATADTVAMKHDPNKYEIVVSATKITKNSEEVPNATAVVTGAELRRRGTRTVAEAMQDLVGVDTGEGSDNGMRLPNIGVWGLKEFDALLVTVDGVPAGGPFNPSLSQIAVEDIDRIEVVKGPQGTLYGVSAFAGMVQVFTRQGEGGNGHFTAGGGSFSDGHASASGNLAIGNGISMRAGGAIQRSDGWQDRTGSEIDRGYVSASRALGKGTIGLDLGMARDTQKWGTPRPFDEDNGVPFEDFKVDKNYAVGGARLDHHLLTLNSRMSVPLENAHRIENTLGLTQDLQNQVRSFVEPDSLLNGSVPSEGVSLRPKESTAFDDVRLVSNFKLKGEHESVVGAALTWGRTIADGHGFDFDQDVNDPASIPDVGAIPPGDDRSFEDRRTYFGAYAHDAWTPIPWLTLSGGGRWDHAEEKLHAQALELSTNVFVEADDHRIDEAWSGDISGLARLARESTPMLQVANVYASYRSSFKPAAPNLTEAEGAEILEPERTHSIEGGLKSRWFDRQVSFDASVFQMDFTNMVVPILGPGGTPELTNAGKERFKGFELGLGLQPNFTPGTHILLGYAHHDARFVEFTNINPAGELEDFNGNRLELVPGDLWNAKVDWAAPMGIGLFAAARYQGKRALNRDNTHYADPYTEFDAGGSYQFQKARVSIVGRNLGDDRHVVTESDLGESQLYVAPPRRVTAEISVGF